jgi:superfamily II DNA or RNA helicase
MKHASIRRRLATDLAAMLTSGNLPVTLYPYQTETFESTINWLEDKKGSRRGYVAQATGLGKTVEFAALIQACEGLRVLVIEPSKQLVEQTVRRLVGFTKGKIAHASSLNHIRNNKGEVIASRWKDKNHDVLVTTDETFKLSFPRIKTDLDPDVIVWDECHWAYTVQAQAALLLFPEAVVIGFSATPDYLGTVAKATYAPVTLDNGQVLYGDPNKFARTHFGQLLDERTARWGIQNNWLAPLAWGQLEFGFSLDDVPTVQRPEGMDYDPAALQKVMATNWSFVIKMIQKLYLSGQYDLGRRFSAAICPGVLQAQALAHAVNKLGVPAACITGATKDADRDRILKECSEGRIGLLTSVFVLREGWDAPNAEVAMMLRPTKSRVLYVQFMGRVLRKFGKKIALVMDPHYSNTQFSPLSAPVLFGEPGQEVRDGGYLIRPPVITEPGGEPSREPYWVRNMDKLAPVLKVQPLEIEYWADKEGKFEADGEVWGTLMFLERVLGISEGGMRPRVKECRHRFARGQVGHVRTFYALSDVRKACKDLLGIAHRADKEGKFKADGEVWGTVKFLARAISISEPTIKARVNGCRNRSGKDQNGNPRVFYALSDVRKACKDLLGIAHRADKEGKFKADGEVWGVVTMLERSLDLSWPAIQPRINGCRNRSGKDQNGNPRVFYALSDVRKACKDLLGIAHRADKEGKFKADGEVWATIFGLTKLVRFSRPAVKHRVRHCRRREGRDAIGRKGTFYALSDMRKACKNVQRRNRKN